MDNINRGQRLQDNKAGFLAQLEHNSHKSDIDIELYAYLSKAGNCKELQDLILEKINHMGFNHFSFIRLRDTDCDPGLLTTIPKDLSSTYYGEQYGQYDMLLSYAAFNSQPIYRSEIDSHAFLNTQLKTHSTITNREIHLLNKRYKFYDYYCVFSEPDDKLGKSMLSVSVKGMSPFDFRQKISGCETTLQLLCDAIYHIVIQRFSDHFLSSHEDCDIKISSRPLQVLDILANDDLSVNQVADKLNISVATVNQHLIAAKKAFGVNTNIGAIKQAVLMKLISYKK